VKILLTGATGFIGSHVARVLVQGGHDVHAVVRPASNRRRIADIERALTLHTGEMDHVPVEPDLLIHLAWYAVPGQYLAAPENRDCLAASLRLLRRAACRVVFAGTCFEFDTTLGRLNEDSPTKPTTLYAESKDALRREVEERPDAVWARFFYQYGPWEDERRLVPSIMRAVLRGEPAAAVCAIATSRLTGAVNVGSGEAPSVKEIAHTVASMAGRPDLLRFGSIPYGPGEPMLIQADNARLRSTGWIRRYSLEEGLRQTLDWWAHLT
jgi:nucleoside-diphosphate-sugar epimerase